MQEGVGAAIFNRVDGSQRGIQICQINPILGMLVNPQRGQGFHRAQWLSRACFPGRFTKKAPYIVLGGCKHNAIVAPSGGGSGIVAVEGANIAFGL